jgi:hypothetical protein
MVRLPYSLVFVSGRGSNSNVILEAPVADADYNISIGKQWLPSTVKQYLSTLYLFALITRRRLY